MVAHILCTNTPVASATFHFISEKNDSMAQLNITKRESADCVYSIFIKFLGLKENRTRWEVGISKIDHEVEDLTGCVNFLGSLSFIFEPAGDHFIRITERDANEESTTFIDLYPEAPLVLDNLPPIPIRKLLIQARSEEIPVVHTTMYNDSIVLMIFANYILTQCTYQVYAGDVESVEMTKCPTRYSSNGHPGMIALEVDFKGKTNLLEVFPPWGQLSSIDEVEAWNGQKLNNGGI